MRILIATLSVLFAACVILVSWMNRDPVTVILWPDSPEYTYPNTQVSWVIFWSAFAGAVFMGIVALLEGSKIRFSNARLKAQVRKLQQEIEILRRPSLDLLLAESRTSDPGHVGLGVASDEADDDEDEPRA